ncbi:nitrate/nitrite transporter [Ammoniphilus sp. 3BR4]|uniref:MFS transporter n=1 Tax=Ammoniphilus sp. 3BR4 TaxID=3158265 RepID=UPI0034678692
MEKATFTGYLNGVFAMIMTFLTSIILVAPAPIMTTIVEESHWNLGQTGYLLSAIYATTVISVFVGSVFIEKIGAKWTAVISLAMVAIGGVMAFFSGDNFVLHLIARVIVGIGYGLYFPLPGVIVAQWIPRTQQPAWLGARTSISTLGVSAGFYFTLPVLGFMHTWQATLGFYGIITAVLFVISIFVLREPKRSEKANAAEQADSQVGKMGLARVVKNKIILKTCVLIIGVGITSIAFMDYLPAFLELEHGMSKEASSKLAGVSPIGSASFGFICGLIMTALGRRKIIGLSSLILIFFSAMLIIFMDNYYVVLAGAFLFGVGSVGYFVYYSMISLDLSKSDPSFIGAAFAIILACAWSPAFFVPAIFQALLNLGMSMQIVMLIFTIPTLGSIFLQMFIEETGPKAKQKQMQAETITRLAN